MVTPAVDNNVHSKHTLQSRHDGGKIRLKFNVDNDVLVKCNFQSGNKHEWMRGNYTKENRFENVACFHSSTAKGRKEICRLSYFISPSTGASSKSSTSSLSLGTGEAIDPAAVVDVPSTEQTALEEANSNDQEGSPEVEPDSNELDRDVDESWLQWSIAERECQSKVTLRRRRT
ncbi:hypothetical protein EVAR_81696_1 [Eumeta japonica]|uniref:Uncharacterized protein n=1 Tax=Eumeta variegata TaxID=151549 RepID=A0A4C1V4H4_EUMVA|nr:hypothetical protein EVAR_81696_1 [Eumeta japonica]